MSPEQASLSLASLSEVVEAAALKENAPAVVEAAASETAAPGEPTLEAVRPAAGTVVQHVGA